MLIDYFFSVLLFISTALGCCSSCYVFVGLNGRLIGFYWVFRAAHDRMFSLLQQSNEFSHQEKPGNCNSAFIFQLEVDEEKWCHKGWSLCTFALNAISPAYL